MEKETLSYALDTETTGLRWFDEDSAFALVYIDDKEKLFLSDFKDISQLKVNLENKSNIAFFMNAKFDLHMLRKMGIEVKSKIYDVKVLDRILFNQHQKYSLLEIGKRQGFEKQSDVIEKQLKDNELYRIRVCKRTGRENKIPEYNKVDTEAMESYALQDGIMTKQLGEKLLKEIESKDIVYSELPAQKFIIENESKLVKVLFEMEELGVKLDEDFLKQGYKFYKDETELARKKIEEKAMIPFVKGDTFFQQIFKDEESLWQKTEIGNYRWDKYVLCNFQNPIKDIVLDYAEKKKQLDYFENFLFMADEKYILHANIDQAGTKTGRMSSNEPNLQNLTSPDKYEDEAEAAKYPIRKAIIPRAGYFFLMVDYKQIEYRVFLDKAGATNLISKIKSGLDVHEATAQAAKVTRKEAKTCNFSQLYGGGLAQLVKTLYTVPCSKAQVAALYRKINNWRLTVDEEKTLQTIKFEDAQKTIPYIQKADALRKSISKSAPEIAKMTKAMQARAENTGFIFNHFGRRCYFPNKNLAYQAANHWTQGTCADVLKIAMVNIFAYLEDKKSKMVLTIHDELVFEIAFGEEWIIEPVKKMMIEAYSYKELPLDVDAEYSLTNLADKKPWNLENFLSETTRDASKNESDKPPQEAPIHMVH